MLIIRASVWKGGLGRVVPQVLRTTFYMGQWLGIEIQSSVVNNCSNELIKQARQR